MEQYIKKSALVAEIERRLKANGAFDEMGDAAWWEDKGMCDAYKSILSFVDTLEVIEIGVDVGSPEGDLGRKTVQVIDADGNISEVTFNKAQKRELSIAKKLKYKDLIKKLKPFENDEIVMVASTGEVSFYDKDGMFNIIHLSELENEEHCFVTRSED